jgi:phosphoglycolate phosphatase
MSVGGLKVGRRYALIVFDWDGTLIDSTPAIAECIRLAARDMDLPVPTLERASHVIGLGLRDSLRHAVPELPEHGHARFVECYRRHFLEREDTMAPFPGVPELLAELHARGHRLAVATGKSRRGLDRALEASGLAPIFAATRCGDETRPKPHPAMLLELLQELQADPRGALMVGDTSHDLEMARSAGIDALAVAYGAHPGESLRALEPRGCVASIEELRRWLETHA